MDEIDQTTWRDEIEKMIKDTLPRMPGGITIRGKSALFIDNIAKIAYKVAQKFNEMHGGDLERQFANILRYMIDEIATHEFIHSALEKPSEVPKKAWESYIQHAASKLAREMTRVDWMVWQTIPCPKKNGEIISLTDCFSCSDQDKSDECPPWGVRKSLSPRITDKGNYHVTELCYPRYSFYDRTLGFTAFWDWAMDFLIGKAIHFYIHQLNFPKEWLEIYVWWDVAEEDILKAAERLGLSPTLVKGRHLKIVGGIDAYDPVHQVLHEGKGYATLYFILKRDAPEPDNVFQAQSYVKLAKMSQPWINPKTVKIEYYAKVRVRGEDRNNSRLNYRYKEFSLKPQPPEDLVDRGLILDISLETGKPPNIKCPGWKCPECHYSEKCKRDGWA